MLNLDNLNIVLFVLPIYQLLFYSVQMITLRKKNDPSKRSLGLLMLIMVIYLVINASGYLEYSLVFKYAFIFQIPVLLTILPTYYLYFISITKLSYGKLQKHPLIYYFPSIFILTLNIIAFIKMTPDQISSFLGSSDYFTSVNDEGSSFLALVFLLGNVTFVAGQVIITVTKYASSIHELIVIKKTNTGYLPYFQITWSNIILVSVISFVSLSSIMNLLIPDFNQIISSVFNIGFLVTGGLAGYLSLKQDKLFIEVANLPKTEIINSNNYYTQDSRSNPAINDFNETVNKDETSIIVSKLKHYIVNEKPYLNSNLRIIDLAREIDISKNKLTYVINNVMETNFYGIMNKYRVIEAKELLVKSENKNYNIDVISEMAGFQSKSSFNACFKKVTGQTPSEFRKSKTNI